MEDESVVPIAIMLIIIIIIIIIIYEGTVGEFNHNTPNTSRQGTVRTLQASPFQEPTLNAEEIPRLPPCDLL